MLQSRMTSLRWSAIVAIWVLTVVLATSFGSVSISASEVVRAIGHAFGLTAADSSWAQTIVVELRLPRVLLASLCGGGLAISGAAMQGLFRNPMADPGIVGVSAGAALGAVGALYVTSALALYAVPLFAFLGGTGCAWLVYRIATRRGRASVTSLLLAGVAVGGIANALVSLVLMLSLADWEVGREMLGWLMGGLEGRSWPQLTLAAPMVVGGAALLLAYGRDLNLLLTGEESALSLGVDVPRVRRDLIALSSLVTAATVAVIGVVGFVGLVVPHVVRLWVGADHRKVMPLSFVAGGIFLPWADLLCRVTTSIDLRLGVITSLLGGPYFLFLLIRHQHEGRNG